MDDQRVWYFAYGSNMQSDTFRGRRGIDWSHAVAGIVRGWRLVFDKPSMMHSASSFANIVPDPKAHVMGVAYQISYDELEHVELTEGVALGNYARALVSFSSFDGGHTFDPVYTLSSELREPEKRPSTRYMGLVIAGAEEHGLPSEWIDALRAIPAREESPEEIEARARLDQALRSLRLQKKEPR